MNQFRMSVRVNRLCMNPLTPLDGSIAAMVNRGVLPNMDMFEHHHGVPMASFPIFESVHTTDESVVRDIERHFINGGVPEAILNENGGMPSIIGSKASNYHRGSVNRVYYPRNGLLTYYFTGQGDVVSDLITKFGAIGAWTGKGYGTLIPDPQGNLVYISEQDDANPHWGIVDNDNRLLRPVPIGMARDLRIDPKTYVAQTGRSSIPYGPWAMRRYGHPVEKIAVPNFGIEHD